MLVLERGEEEFAVTEKGKDVVTLCSLTSGRRHMHVWHTKSRRSCSISSLGCLCQFIFFAVWNSNLPEDICHLCTHGIFGHSGSISITAADNSPDVVPLAYFKYIRCRRHIKLERWLTDTWLYSPWEMSLSLQFFRFIRNVCHLETGYWPTNRCRQMRSLFRVFRCPLISVSLKWTSIYPI